MNSQKLVGTVATVFGVMRILTALGLLVGIVLILPFGGRVISGTIPFSTPPPSSRSASSEIGRDSVSVTVTKAQVEMSSPHPDAEFRGMARACTIGVMVMLALALVILELLYRLFRNVQRGEIFSARNLRIIRAVGFAQIAGALALTFVQIGFAARVGAYVASHSSFSVAPVWSLHSIYTHLDLGDLLTGLIVLVVAECFRQGLALKQEADLTV